MKIILRKRFVLVFLLLVLFAGLFLPHSSALAQENTSGVSGIYSSLMIGIDKNNETLTGFFSQAGGWDENTKAPMFNCELFIYGKLQGSTYKLTTRYPGEKEYIAGELRFVKKGGEKTIEITLETEPGGCGNVHPFSRKVGGDDFILDEKGDWSEVRIISAKKAYFYPHPNAAKAKAYVVAYDPVRIFNTQNGWVEAEFGTGKKTRGWLKEADLFPANSAN